MLLLLGFYKRQPGLTHEEFCRIWSEEYGPLYRESPEITRLLRRYVQHRLTPVPGGAHSFIGFDGFSEAWFDNEEANQEMRKTKYYLEVLKPMTSRFLDLEGTIYSAHDDQIVQVGSKVPIEDARD